MRRRREWRRSFRRAYATSASPAWSRCRLKERTGATNMRGSATKERITSKGAGSRVEVVAETLEHYARRGVFRGFSRGPVKNGRATFRMVWHQDRVFDFIFDANRGTMRFPLVLPDVPARSRMYLDLKAFIESRKSAALPDHRRIDSRKAQVGSYVRS